MVFVPAGIIRLANVHGLSAQMENGGGRKSPLQQKTALLIKR